MDIQRAKGNRDDAAVIKWKRKSLRLRSVNELLTYKRDRHEAEVLKALSQTVAAFTIPTFCSIEDLPLHFHKRNEMKGKRKAFHSSPESITEIKFMPKEKEAKRERRGERQPFLPSHLAFHLHCSVSVCI